MDAARQNHFGRKAAAVSFLLIAVVFAVYWPTLHYEFVNFDDLGYIIQNRNIQHGFTLETWRWAFTSFYAGNWHPVTWLSHTLDWQLYQLRSGGYHFTNDLIHAVNTVLVFLVLLRTMNHSETPNTKHQAPETIQTSSSKLQSGNTINFQPSTISPFWPCALVAALFGLHPMHVESVAWIAERKDVLSTFFFLLTIWAYVRFTQTTGQSDQQKPVVRGPWSVVSNLPSSVFYLLALGLFALGLMSKPMLVTTPFILLLLDYWPLRRLQLLPIAKLRTNDSGLLTLLIEKVPFFLLSAADCVLTYKAQSHTGAVASAAAAPIDTRVCNAMLSYGAYLVKFFWPGHMAVYYPLREDPSLTWVAISIATLASITVLVILCLRRCPYLPFGWFWFVGTLVPVIGLVQVGLQAMADRYTYIPYIGLSIGLVWLLTNVLSRARQRQSGCLRMVAHPALWTALAVVAVGACAISAAHQVRYWQTSETLWRQAVRVTSGNAVARQNLGSALTEQRRFAEAAHEFEEALKVKPMYAEAESNFGFVLFMLGRNDEAVAHYRRALQMKPIGRTHYLLAKTLMAEGKTLDAMNEYKRAIEIEPELPPALNDLAWILAANPDPALRNGPEAARLAERACETSLTPNPLFIGTLAAAYAEAGRFPEAISTAERAKALALQEGNQAIAEKNEELLQLYRAGKPYHEPEPNPARLNR